ncbi:MAG: L-seryl-tRNA(Sec) selenium transferase [Coriobacteriia bacterium]|nr:L-seryl-tRNA(Sec) selenium transferase [Coriobacteriia bacterium]
MASSPVQEALRGLPSVNEIFESPGFELLGNSIPHELALKVVRDEIDVERKRLVEGASEEPASHDGLAARCLARLRLMGSPSLKRSINAAGVIIHTNLGRSALAPAAIEAVNEVARGYSTLEYDTQTMTRGSRHSHYEQLICAITGAEAALAVNNNAAAVMMVLSEFAQGKEAIVSRGEEVEIGGSFRIPDIMAYSNARMIEVGTTNKTHPEDYERAIGPDTALLLKVHTSNYRMIGFTESVTSKQLRSIARKHQENGGQEIITYEDLGSGVLADLDVFRLANEPTVASVVAQGADIVSFSGDKLLGGPQAGIIVGKKRFIDRLKKNPLARALRLDKMTLAALETTLRIYLDPEQAVRDIPTLAMLAAPAEEMKNRAESLASLTAKKIRQEETKVSLIASESDSGDQSARIRISVIPEVSRAGGGALPMFDIPTFCMKLSFAQEEALDCDRFLNQSLATPIVGRLNKGELLFDPRTLLPGEEEEVAEGLARYFRETPKA